MFRGVNTLNLDSKGRLAIPVRFREILKRHCNGQMVITVNRNGHSLLLYPLPEWEEIERKLVKLPSFNKQARRLQLLLVGHATECELDGSGRIRVPPPLREFAGLQKAVVLIGQINKFEIWSEQAWNAQLAECLEQEDAEEGGLSDDLRSLSL